MFSIVIHNTDIKVVCNSLHRNQSAVADKNEIVELLSLSRVVGDISWDELEVSPSELVVLLALNVRRAPVALSVGGRGQLGVQSATGTILFRI